MKKYKGLFCFMIISVIINIVLYYFVPNIKINGIIIAIVNILILCFSQKSINFDYEESSKYLNKDTINSGGYKSEEDNKIKESILTASEDIA